MHNVNLDQLQQTVDKAHADPGALRQPVNLDGQWQIAQGAAVPRHHLLPGR
jgi:hypothetical protein